MAGADPQLRARDGRGGVAGAAVIATVLFDMNDVLCRYDRAKRIAALARVCDRTPAFVEAAIFASGFEDSGDAGALDADAYLAGFGERLSFPLTRAQWAAALADAITPLAPALALAGRVAREAEVAVLTNNNLLVRAEIDALFPELRPIFADKIFVSAEFGARKPDPEAYIRCLARLGAAAQATLFVDDSAKNVAGAEQAGLEAHLYRGVDELSEALRREGLLSAHCS